MSRNLLNSVMAKSNINLFRLLLIFSLSIAGLFSCSNPVKEELNNYVNKDLPKLVEQETEARNAYNSVTGPNYQNDLIFYTVLKDSVVPLYKAYVQNLEAVSYTLKNDEVQSLNESLVEAVQMEYSGIFLMLSAIDKQDYSEISKANEKMNNARKLFLEWQSELDSLCKLNDVIINTPR